MSRNIRTFIAMALPLLAFAIVPSAAKAQSFTGNYPVLETQVKAGIAGTIKGGNQNFCLVLTDDGAFGRPHSGTATLEGFDGGSLTGGEFYVIGNNILVNFVVGSSTGEASALVLFAPANASKGTIGTGILGLTGGVPSTGLATVGAKNGC
ncbi:MAG TPA: hypothetical protein VN310_02845 [Candidatus Dormibacteraeota bacterium]|nr:hypothetical protein [Candidatus Dormibacteraeota bacterium]